MDIIGIIATIIGIIATILGGVWFIIQKAFKMGENNHRLDSVENRLNSVENRLNSVENRLTSVEQNITSLQSELNGVAKDISAIKAVLIQKFPNAAIAFAMKNSPRKLNPNGEWLFNEIKGEEFLKENKSFLFNLIDKSNPKTALDVENAANFACTMSTNEDMFIRLKNFVYNCPTIKLKNDDGTERDYEVSLGDVCFVLSLPLRDMYLKENPHLLNFE